VINLPSTYEQMAQLCPSLSIVRIEFNRTAVCLQQFRGIMQEGQSAEVTEGCRRFVNVRGPACHDRLENRFSSFQLSLCQLDERLMNARRGIWLRLLLGQGCHGCGECPDLILVRLLPLLECMRLIFHQPHRHCFGTLLHLFGEGFTGS
jgi:hypothetical protein